MNIKKITLAMLLTITLIFSFTSCATTDHSNDPNFLGDFDGQGVASLMGGTVSLVKKTIKPTKINFILYPRTNILTFDFRNKRSMDNISLALNQENRELIIQALEKFLTAYDEQNFTIENNNKKAFFGKTEIVMAWGIFGKSKSTKVTLRCEYQILTNDRPYFILGNAMTKNEDGENSPSARLAFSPAQCEQLITIMNQENLLKIVEEKQKAFDTYDTNSKNKSKNAEEKESKINYN